MAFGVQIQSFGTVRPGHPTGHPDTQNLVMTVDPNSTIDRMVGSPLAVELLLAKKLASETYE